MISWGKRKRGAWKKATFTIFENTSILPSRKSFVFIGVHDEKFTAVKSFANKKSLGNTNIKKLILKAYSN